MTLQQLTVNTIYLYSLIKRNAVINVTKLKLGESVCHLREGANCSKHHPYILVIRNLGGALSLGAHVRVDTNM